MGPLVQTNTLQNVIFMPQNVEPKVVNEPNKSKQEQ